MDVNLSPGDSIICKVKDSKITTIYESADFIAIFDILSKYNEGYIINIPFNISIKNATKLDMQNCKKYNAPTRFVGCNILFITNHHVLKIHKHIDGMMCKECLSFSNMSRANQPDGTFICWNCTTYPFYK